MDKGHGADVLVAAVALLALSATAWAMPNSPTLLYQTPTADVLPAGALAISADGTFPLVSTSMNVNYPEADANIRFSPFRRLDFALTAYTFADYVLDVKYNVLGDEPDRFGLAVGVYDIGLNSYVSPIGHDTANAWPDWKHKSRTTERFSAFAVTSIPVTQSVRLHVGLGRGRFVGYATHSRYFNSDIFFNEYHQWAVALFGGVEVYLTPQVALVAEAGSRDFNTGVKVNYGAFTATVAWTKMEGLVFAKGEPNGTAKFGRLEASLTCQFNNLSGLSNLVPRFEPRYRPPTEPVPPPPEPVEVPTGPAPSPEELKLEPIWFNYDKWDITPEAAAALRRNAQKLLAHPDVKIVITGCASEEGTPEYNSLLSGRRAYAAFEYLKSLGVPGRQMRFKAQGESAGRPYPPHRTVYFEIEGEK
jgi:outer membrane protein OmpA-like peptidoglycan-associated protein